MSLKRLPSHPWWQSHSLRFGASLLPASWAALPLPSPSCPLETGVARSVRRPSWLPAPAEQGAVSFVFSCPYATRLMVLPPTGEQCPLCCPQGERRNPKGHCPITGPVPHCPGFVSFPISTRAGKARQAWPGWGWSLRQGSGPGGLEADPRSGDHPLVGLPPRRVGLAGHPWTRWWPVGPWCSLGEGGTGRGPSKADGERTRGFLLGGLAGGFRAWGRLGHSRRGSGWQGSPPEPALSPLSSGGGQEACPS